MGGRGGGWGVGLPTLCIMNRRKLSRRYRRDLAVWGMESFTAPVTRKSCFLLLLLDVKNISEKKKSTIHRLYRFITQYLLQHIIVYLKNSGIFFLKRKRWEKAKSSLERR